MNLLTRWDLPGAAYDRTRGNRRNWYTHTLLPSSLLLCVFPTLVSTLSRLASPRILAWEDGFCNFAAAAAATPAACGQEGAASAAVAYAGDGEVAVAAPQEAAKHHQQQQPPQGLQPELFFKMSHDIYNYGEG
jgi:hypothetical protein